MQLLLGPRVVTMGGLVVRGVVGYIARNGFMIATTTTFRELSLVGSGLTERGSGQIRRQTRSEFPHKESPVDTCELVQVKMQKLSPPRMPLPLALSTRMSHIWYHTGRHEQGRE